MVKTWLHRKKTPQELAASLEKKLFSLEAKEDDASTKSTEKITPLLAAMRFGLTGDEDPDSKGDIAKKLTTQLIHERANILVMLVKHLVDLEFEAQQDAVRILKFLLRNGKENQSTEYVLEHPRIIEMLIDGYGEPLIALHCGPVLREFVKHQELCEMTLYMPRFFRFFDFVQDQNFDVASDAFLTFKAILTLHKKQCAKFLDREYDTVILGHYNKLITSDNYVTRRQSLKLLGEILLDREHFKIMMRYINDAANLKIMMNLLREKSGVIQYEAFHVFKVFVANPKKSAPVLDILYRNREKLIDYLTKFQKDKDDDQFVEEKQILLQELENLQPEEGYAS